MHHARRSVCVWLSLLLFVFHGMGFTSTASAFDSATPPVAIEPETGSAGAPLRDLTPIVKDWPARCAELEAAGKTSEASRCWWLAAEAILRYVAEARVSVDVKKLRAQWLWRGARLSLQASKPEEPPPPAVASPAPPKPTAPASPAKKKLAKAKSQKAKSPAVAKNRKTEAVVEPTVASAGAVIFPPLKPAKKTNVISRYLRQPEPNDNRSVQRDCIARWWSEDASAGRQAVGIVRFSSTVVAPTAAEPAARHRGRADEDGRVCCGQICICVLSAGTDLAIEMNGVVEPIAVCR